MKASNSFVLNAAVAGLIAGSISVATTNSASAADVMCTNSCNGHSLGKGTTASKSCAGTIHKKMSARACKKAGGTVVKNDAAPAAGGEAPAAAPAPADAPKQ